MADDFYYKILGVNSAATEQEIRDAYQQSVNKRLSDVDPESWQEASQRYRQLRQAFMVLTDPERRQAYDQARSDAQFRQVMQDQEVAWELKNGTGSTLNSLSYQAEVMRTIEASVPGAHSYVDPEFASLDAESRDGQQQLPASFDRQRDCSDAAQLGRAHSQEIQEGVAIRIGEAELRYQPDLPDDFMSRDLEDGDLQD